jgi:hypothetical protein
MKKIALCSALLASLLFTGSAFASTVSYTISDILSTPSYTVANSGQTYAGTGFVGMYNGNSFGHLFGLEGAYSKTNMEVDISALAGAHIVSASLGFVLMENYGQTGTLTITGYDATGALGYQYNAPTAAYGAVSNNFANGAQQSFDVTSLVQAALLQNENWLGMHLENSAAGRWSYTGTSQYSVDRAQARLLVEFAPAANVPEPGPLALIGLGLAGLAAAGRRKTRSA